MLIEIDLGTKDKPRPIFINASIPVWWTNLNVIYHVKKKIK
jgi:hypothetical protein